MYEGSNKTAICSQKAFAAALVRLLGRKAYADITISELCQESGVSRQTFYALFQTKDNVLRFEIMRNYAFPEHLELPENCSTARYISQVFAIYIDANYDFLKLLMEQNLMHVFYQCIVSQISAQDLMLTALAPGQEQFMIRSLIGTACGIINGCVSSAERWSVRQLEDMIYLIYSGDLYRKTIPQNLRPSREDK